MFFTNWKWGVTGGRHYTKVASCFCPLPCAHPWSFSITSVLSPDVLTEQIRTPPCLEVVFWPGAVLEKHCHPVWSHPWKRRGGAGRGKKVHARPQKSVGVCGTSGCLFVLHRQQAGGSLVLRPGSVSCPCAHILDLSTGSLSTPPVRWLRSDFIRS